MDVEDHFDRLVDDLPQIDKDIFNACKHNRVETAYKKRHFIVYEMSGGHPHELDRITVNDFHADHTHGITTEVASRNLDEKLIVSYTPQRLFHFPMFVWVPLHAKVRWGATADDIHHGSLGFPLVLRTQSRLGLREDGVTYCETGVSYGKEFDAAHVG